MKYFLAFVFAVAGYFLLWPTKIDPQPWVAPSNSGLTNEFAPNEILSAGRFMEPAVGLGPEGIDFDSQGRLWTSLRDGSIVRFDPEIRESVNVANTGGQPLGVQFDGDGNLLVADAFKGLLKIDMEGKIETLVDSIDGKSILLADDLDVMSDGSIWFSDASTRFDFNHLFEDAIESVPSGRLLKYDPSTGNTEVKISNLSFANGVAFGPGEEYVLVAESNRYRITRLWLKGQKAGETDVFVDSLPGMPDNITFNGEDIFWVSIFSQRSEALDRLSGSPWVRKIISRVPHMFLPEPQKIGFVIGLNARGEVVRNYQESPDVKRSFTSAIEKDGYLYLGSLEHQSVFKFPLER